MFLGAVTGILASATTAIICNENDVELKEREYLQAGATAVVGGAVSIITGDIPSLVLVGIQTTVHLHCAATEKDSAKFLGEIVKAGLY